jgi:hypothetical protein
MATIACFMIVAVAVVDVAVVLELLLTRRVEIGNLARDRRHEAERERGQAEQP